MSKVLITGGTGLIGSKLVKKLSGMEEIHYTSHQSDKRHRNAKRHQLDITDSQKTVELIKEIEPSIIIHTAALTDVDQCEEEKKLAYKLNVKGTKNILKGCREAGSKLVFFSSSFVFDGKDQIHTESTETNPINYYGKTKEKSEEAILEDEKDHIILRTDQPYCLTEPRTKTMLDWTITNLERGEKFGVFTDWYNNPTWLSDITRATEKLIQNNSEGIFHVTGPNYINRYEWAVQIAAKFGYNSELIEKSNSDSTDLKAERPNVNMGNKKIQSEIDIEMTGLDRGLEEEREKL